MSRQIKAFIVLLLLSGGGMVLGGRLAKQAMADNKDYYESLEVFSQVLHRIRQDYVEEVDVDRVMQGAINGMIKTLDPYSQYMTPKQYQQFQEETSGDYFGIGVEISQEKEGLRIISPYPGSPAEKAGLEPNDLIVKVDGAQIAEIGSVEAVSRIKGRKGTKVVLGVIRGDWKEPRDMPVERDQIHMPAVVSSVLEHGYGYVRVIQFQDRVASEVQDAVKAMEKDSKTHLKGIILDLRNNPGGLLEEAVKLSDLFLDQGVIVKTEGRHSEPEIERARRGGTLEGFPLVVLINEGSASASEIVAGALQDHKRAVLVGERSYGKGSVQNIIRLDNDGALRLTVARYFTPSGRPIDPKNSITPDVAVAAEGEAEGEIMDETDSGALMVRDQAPDLKQDTQLREALAQLKNPANHRRAEVPTSQTP